MAGLDLPQEKNKIKREMRIKRQEKHISKAMFIYVRP